MLDDLARPRRGDERRLDRLPPRRLLVEDREVHVAVLGEGERARDRRRRHHQHVDGVALCAQVHALEHAEAVLLVDDREAEVVEFDVLLEERVGADDDVDLAGRQRPHPGRPLASLVAAGQHRQAHPRGLGEGREREQVLAGEDLGRRHHRRLAAGLDGREHGEERDQGLAGADVALEQTVHPQRRRPCRR